MIYVDMSFWHMAGLAIVILFAVIGLVAFSITLFRVMNDPQDYVEDDEWNIDDWQDAHKAVEAWKNRDHEC